MIGPMGMNPMMNANMMQGMFSPSQMKGMQDKLLKMSDHVLKALETSTGMTGLADKYSNMMKTAMGRTDMIKPGGCCKPHTPTQGLDRAVTIDLNRAGKNAHANLRNTGFSAGGFESMLIDSKIDGSSKRGGFLGLGRNKSQRRARAFEAKTNPKSPCYDKAFTAKVERSLNGKIVPGAIDGKLTVIPNGTKLPQCFGAGSVSSHCGGPSGGGSGAPVNLMTGLMKAMQNIAGVAAGLVGGGGIAGALSGNTSLGMGIGGSLAGLWAGNKVADFLSPSNMRDMKTSFRKAKGGNRPNGMVANLPKGASFEDMMAAFLFDFVQDKQDEVMKEVEGMKKKEQKKNSIGNRMMSGVAGMLPMIGNVAGMAFGPLGSMAGGALGSLAGGAIKGNKETPQSDMLKMEQIKQKMNDISSMVQTLSNILKAMHDSKMVSVRNLK